MSGRGSLADFGLVSLVLGGGASLLLGMAAIGVGALLGRIPLVLGVLLGLATVVTVIGLSVTVVTARTRRTDRRSETERDGSL